ncbi:hypothetical protein K438DRAFT_1974559 [Mycena galopus ATCC 62051]|nr:hypothetical protein K438DRAFT_1974559 [Mycena galopus ATCC 62051]
MTPSASSEELVQQIQIGLYVVTAEVFLYGAYVILFGFYLYKSAVGRDAAHHFG